MKRVALCTALLSLGVAYAASVLTGTLFRLWGLEVARVDQVMALCAAMCLILAPVVLGPFVWLGFRQHDLAARLRRAALTDPLTGLANRRAFFQHLAERLGGASDARRFSILVIDLDRFKDINDTLGHEAGDAALVFATARVRDALQRAAERDSLLARLGGEEFAVFLEGAGEAAAARAAEAICAGLRAAPFAHAGRLVPLTASVGAWSGAWGEAGCVDAALAAADRAVYVAKAQGRDRWAPAGRDAPPLAAAPPRPCAA